METPTKKEVTEQLKEEIRLRSLDQEHHIRTTQELRAAEKRIEELEQLTKGTDVFQVSHPANLFWHRFADHGLRIYTHGDVQKRGVNPWPYCLVKTSLQSLGQRLV